MALSTKTTPRGRAAAKAAKAAKATKKKGKVVGRSRATGTGRKQKKGAVAMKAMKRTSTAAGNSSRAKPGTVAHQSKFARRNWAKRLVWKGAKAKTSTGLFKRDLMVNARGSIVSKRKSAIGRQRYHENHLDLWTRSLMQTRGEQGISGFVLCKKAGSSKERNLFTSTRSKWQDAVATRMMAGMQRRPEIMAKMSKMIAASSPYGAGASSSSQAANVKQEGAGHAEIVPGDHVRVQKGSANFEYRGQMGVVGRFQLGRVVVNFQGTLKAVKLEDLTRV